MRNLIYADKGIAPLSTGHEPIMLLLHQSALVFVFSAKWAIYVALLARGLNNYVSQSESKAPKSCLPFNKSPV